MAPASTTAVDFRLLDLDLESGDVISLRFKRDRVRDAWELYNMIKDGIFDSQDTIALLAVAETRDWGMDRNRSVELAVTDKCDVNAVMDFGTMLQDSLEMLEIKTRKRPLIDLTALERSGTVKYHFKPNDIVGVDELLMLHELDLIRLNYRGHLEEAVRDGCWAEYAPYDRGGHFLNLMAGDDNASYREHFSQTILPHLELLRT